MVSYREKNLHTNKIERSAVNAFCTDVIGKWFWNKKICLYYSSNKLDVSSLLQWKKLIASYKTPRHGEVETIQLRSLTGLNNWQSRNDILLTCKMLILNVAGLIKFVCADSFPNLTESWKKSTRDQHQPLCTNLRVLTAS